MMGSDFTNYRVSSLESFRKVVAELLPLLSLGSEVALVGELGTGKTAFVKEVGKFWGVVGEISSPSYVLSQEYPLREGTLEHWDLYRTRSMPEELTEICPSDVIRMVEWADYYPELLERCTVRIDFVIPLGADQLERQVIVRTQT